jgi:hypothetical protein
MEKTTESNNQPARVQIMSLQWQIWHFGYPGTERAITEALFSPKKALNEMDNAVPEWT